jgi:hypothetical protein
MARCEHYQTQLLGYLYDLLEADEQQALRAHLEQCGNCRAALAQAERQKKLLTMAAKAEFPAVRFQPPTTSEIINQEDTAARWVRLPRGSWLGSAVAAGVLLLMGFSGSAAIWGWNYRLLEQHAEVLAAEFTAKNVAMVQARNEHNAVLARKRHEVLDVQAQIRNLVQSQQQKWEELQKAARERQVNVVVSGPQTIQPGAPNSYNLVTCDQNNKPVATQLGVRVLDADKRVLFEQQDINNTTGAYDLCLPADLPVKANSNVFLEVVARKDGNRVERIREELALDTPVFVTHLTTDKPMYRPGETVHFRSLTLERFRLKPAQEDFQLVYTLRKPTSEEVAVLAGSPLLFDEKTQAPLLGPDKKPIRGLGAGDFTLDPTSPGGEYTLTVREAANRFAPQERKFIVNQYENPRLNKELDFTRKSYGPGDDVEAACKVSRVEGGASVAHQPVVATVQIDGKPYGPDGKEGAKPLTLRTDDNGAVSVRFKLPKVIERGQASLSVQFHDGGSTETLVRSIPIVVKKLRVEFFPEGGDLVPGVPNRIYFQAHTMLGKPAELKGRIINQDGQVIVDGVETLHDDREPGINQGMGLFSFTPQTGRKYELKIDTPNGIEGKYELPALKDNGVAMRIPTGTTEAKEAIHVVVCSAARDRTLLVGAYCRGRLMDHKTVVARKGEAIAIDLRPAQEVGGVYRITVFEERPGNANHQQLLPVAERLVYRKPVEQLLVTVKPDKKQYIPGDKVNLSLTALNEKEQPAPAILLVAVVDKSVLTMADEKTFRSMPTHYYLTTEIRRSEDLEYADVLLGRHPKAAAALDLLLGTQGWRRFAEQNPGQFRQQFKEDADRLLVMTGQSPLKSVDLSQQEERWQTEFDAQVAKLHEQEAGALRAWNAAQSDKGFMAKMEAMEKELSHLGHMRAAAVDQVQAQRTLVEKVAALTLPVLVVILVVAVVSLLIFALRQSVSRALPYYALAGGCSILVVGLGLLIHETQLGKGKPAGMAELAKLADPRDELAVARGGGPDVQEQAAELLREEEHLRFDAEKAGDLRAKMRGFGNRDGRLLQEGRGQNEVVPGLKAHARLMEKDKAQNPAFFIYPANANGAAIDMKKALPQELRRTQLGLDAFVKDQQREVFFQQLEATKREAEVEQLLGEKQLPAGGIMAANRLKPLQQGRALGLYRRAGRPGSAPPAGFGVGGMPGKAGKQLGDGLADQIAVPPQPLIVREYAHLRPTNGPSDVRSDFVDTVCWHPVLVLPDGKADISFDLCDAVTSYQVAAVGHTLDGRLGAVTTTLESRLPFALEPKLPIEVTSSDKIDVPVSIANNTSESCRVQVHVTPTGLNLLQGQNDESVTLGADQRTRRMYRLQPAAVEGQARLLIAGQSGPFADSVTRTFQIVPDGFPIVESRSDVLERVARHDVFLPESWIHGTLQCQVQVYPSTLADLQKGLESLLREPGGCFEQTSTSNYPNLLILDYLKESNQAKPETERRARDLLAKGYQKLISFECLDPSRNKRQGYEWFGGTAPAHEALTAYGLLEFRDMARVFDVDANMLDRTRQYLMSRKDGKGGFQRNPRALDSFGHAPEDITNAYIVWALTESGKEDDVARELAALATQAKASSDPYFLSLVATSLINRGKSDQGASLLKSVAAAQKQDGHLDAAHTSITGSGGRDLQIETTALAVLGWLKANRPADFNSNIQKAVKWIGQQRGGYGGFGSTQSTILALKSLIAFTKANKKTPESGRLHLYVGEQSVAHLDFPANVQDALVLKLSDPEQRLKPGKNSVRIEITGKNTFPYTLAWSYQTLQPVSAEGCPVRLHTRLDRATAREGETVHLNATIENATDKGQGMAVAIIGLPGGLTLPEDMKQLKDHAHLRNGGTERGLIAAWETRGRELILYWRDLAPKQKIDVPIDLICRVPGEYHGPASRAYPYYNSDRKYWTEPLQVVIK